MICSVSIFFQVVHIIVLQTTTTFISPLGLIDHWLTTFLVQTLALVWKCTELSKAQNSQTHLLLYNEWTCTLTLPSLMKHLYVQYVCMGWNIKQDTVGKWVLFKLNHQLCQVLFVIMWTVIEVARVKIVMTNWEDVCRLLASKHSDTIITKQNKRHLFFSTLLPLSYISLLSLSLKISASIQLDTVWMITFPGMRVLCN